MAIEKKYKIPSFEDGMDLMKYVPWAREIKNANVYFSGEVARRKGRRLLQEGVFHSLWVKADKTMGYVVKDNYLYKLLVYSESIQLETLGVSGFTSELSYCELNNKVYFTSQVINGYIEDGLIYPIGIPAPVVANPKTTYNALTAYRRNKPKEDNVLYTYTFIDNHTGEESGTSHITNAPTFIPTPPGLSLREYKSHHNGSEFYTTTGKLCETHGLVAMPTGNFICVFKGHLLVANSNILYWSQALRYGLTDPATNFVFLDSGITFIEPIVDKGLYVGTGTGVYYLSGETMQQVSISQVESPAPFYGSATKIKDVDLPGALENQPEVVVWLTEHGFMYGLTGGQVVNVTYDKLRTPDFSRAYTNEQIENGERRLIATVGGDILYNTDKTKNLGEF